MQQELDELYGEQSQLRRACWTALRSVGATGGPSCG